MIAPLSRRALLQGAALAAGSAATGTLVSARAFAAPAARDTRLLLVFLRGAYDAANIIVPTASDFYYAARPSIAIARPSPASGPTDPNAALRLDADWSLHPALKDSMLPLWNARQLAFVPFAGTDDMSRSHFETQDTIELGQPLPGPNGGSRNYASGFMGRLANVLAAGAPGSATKTIAFTADVPLSFRGGPVVPNIALAQAAGKPALDARQSALVAAMYRGQHMAGVDLGRAVNEGFAVREEVFTSITQEMEQAGRGAVNARGFEQAAQRMGHLMTQEFNLAFVDVGGWDTHVNQGGASGNLATRMGDLGRGLAAFASELGPQAWKTTTVIVVSEFGRTFHENGDRGTDHGHGSIYWVLGGGVAGGRMAGPQVALSPQTLNQGRDLPVLTDYRALIGGILSRQYGFGPAQMARIFPGAAPKDLGLV